MKNTTFINADDEILVSVTCLTYNHKEYIRDALESFVNQITSFKYEVIVHDDASSDGTADIIREYAEKYPDIIVPILQKENQYSKKIKIRPNYIDPLIRGKYVAYCEGDDFWTDVNKLQRQIDFLENHPEYSACTHAFKQLDMIDNTEIECHSCNYTGTVTTQQVIEGDGNFFATNSVVALAEHVLNTTYFKETTSAGDYALAISLALKGKIFYIDEVMSCYRYMVPNSWSARNMVDDDKRIKHITEIQATLEEADRYSEFKYHDSFKYIIDKKLFEFYIGKLPIRKLKKKYNTYYKRQTFKKKVYFNIPAICKLILKIKRKIKIH